MIFTDEFTKINLYEIKKLYIRKNTVKFQLNELKKYKLPKNVKIISSSNE